MDIKVWRLPLLIHALLISGCYFKSTIKPINPTGTSSNTTPVISTPLTENHEFIPGAQSSTSTTRSYTKSSTIGHYQSQALKISTTRNYKLYSTVQGQIISAGTGN